MKKFLIVGFALFMVGSAGASTTNSSFSLEELREIAKVKALDLKKMSKNLEKDKLWVKIRSYFKKKYPTSDYPDAAVGNIVKIGFTGWKEKGDMRRNTSIASVDGKLQVSVFTRYKTKNKKKGDETWQPMFKDTKEEARIKKEIIVWNGIN